MFPRTPVQTCIVHLIRNSLRYVPRREFADVARDLKPIFTPVDADTARVELKRFDDDHARLAEHVDLVVPWSVSVLVVGV